MDPFLESSKWAEKLAASQGFIVGKTIMSPEGLIYEVVSVGIGGSEITVRLRLCGQPQARERTVFIREKVVVIWNDPIF